MRQSSVTSHNYVTDGKVLLHVESKILTFLLKYWRRARNLCFFTPFPASRLLDRESPPYIILSQLGYTSAFLRLPCVYKHLHVLNYMDNLSFFSV